MTMMNDSTQAFAVWVECDICSKSEQRASLADAYYAGWIYIGHGSTRPGAFLGRCPQCARRQLEVIAQGGKDVY